MKHLFAILLTMVWGSGWCQTPIPDIFSPQFSYLSGRYSMDLEVQLTTVSPNAVIYYTTDGSEPNSSSLPYSAPISVVGDGTLETIKAVSIRNDSLSLVSSCSYAIDYGYDGNAAYLTDLTLADYNNFIPGDWFGYASSPWHSDYSVKLTILPDGHYIDTTTTGSGDYPFSDVFTPVFYYGLSEPSSTKVITVENVQTGGHATGTVVIWFGSGSTNNDELRFIRFIDNRNLYLEMWHQSQYGPLTYHLTKNEALITSISETREQAASKVYPNPATEVIYVEEAKGPIRITDALGRTYQFAPNRQLSVSHLPRGFYSVQYTNGNGREVRQKLMLW